MLELQYELESKAAKWYATIDSANAFFSIPLAAECRPQFAFTWKGVQYTWNRLPQGWKHSPTICHGLIQTALEKGGAPEHLQYIDVIIVWGNTAKEVFKKGKKVIKVLLKGGFAVKRGYSQIVKPLYKVTRKKNEFMWGPEQQEAFFEMKQEIVHAVVLGPVRSGQDIKNVQYAADGDNGPTWSLWQKAPGETQGLTLGFWS
ncbi:endogenous retrovirus group k member 25 pol [Limosa lapponica baueri]|uniref:ribonuclease H n=1 Tax=Limosa lapponica baueri TaxID=1758121 RepID=A0A2I0TMJ3_LIMLA|nr:endogenous retrovirus group k member 25 pol [Limosa lapponica baueri]